MKKIKTFRIFLALVLMSLGMLQVQAPAGEVTALPEVKTYEELRHAISQARAESRSRVEKAVEQERVREAWEIGRLIDGHVLQHKERADYDKQVIPRLAVDVGMSESELYRMLRFYRIYPKVAAPQELSWAHYRELLSMNDSKEREQMTEQAVSHQWSQKELRREIKKLRSPGVAVSLADSALEARLGTVGTYRVVRGTEENERVLDLGFSNYYTPAWKFPFKEGDIVTSIQDAKGSYELSVLGSKPEALYTYEIKVLEVIDGDTIKAVIDLGFGFRTVQTLRLRGIDAPEIETADGMESKKALEKMLKIADGKTNPKILIKTVKSDKYDRYLADVWVEDRYVNQELLDEGLAVRVEE